MGKTFWETVGGRQGKGTGGEEQQRDSTLDWQVGETSGGGHPPKWDLLKAFLGEELAPWHLERPRKHGGVGVAVLQKGLGSS